MLGGVSLMYENLFDGIAIQAIGLTFGILASLLVCYKSGLIKPTENFRLMVVAGIGGILILYIVNFVMSFFGSGISLLSSTNGSWTSIGLSVGIVCFASLSLVLDFDYIEEGAEKGLPKYMEWYGAFSLMVTLIWLYLEILRLLAKIRSR